MMSSLKRISKASIVYTCSLGDISLWDIIGEVELYNDILKLYYLCVVLPTLLETVPGGKRGSFFWNKKEYFERKKKRI